MKNQVIKVLTKEHGKRVIEWFNSQGVDTGNYTGNISEEEGFKCIYFGVINGNFSNYYIENVINNNAEIIKLPEEDFDMTTNEGRLAYAKKHYPIGTVIKSMYDGAIRELISEPSLYGSNGNYILSKAFPDLFPDIYYNGKWAEIVEEVKEEIVMETQKLSRQGLKEIHSVACSAWKSTLELLGANNPLEDYIELNQDQVDAMFKACTATQLPIVSKYLKQDDGSVDVSKVTYGNHGILLGSAYIVRHDAFTSIKNGFWLNPDFNWEFKINGDYQYLIPTKKK
jgi:hypothetical protein